MADLLQHHARVLGALLDDAFPVAQLSFDPAAPQRATVAPAGGLVTVGVDSLEREDAWRSLVGLSVTFSREALEREDALWKLTADTATLWRLLRRAAGGGFPYTYSSAGGEVTGHSGEEWLELVNLETYLWRSSGEEPPRPALHHAVTSLRLAVNAP
jgi:hypothetical protein